MGGKRKAKEQGDDGDPNGETKEQRKEKKRLKKEEKKKKKEEKKKRKRQSGSIGTSTSAATETTTPRQHNNQHDGQSVFLRKKLHLTVSLLPAALKNVQMSVEDSLRSLILKFSDGIGGILMAFENVQILSDHKTDVVGMILNELPHIHYQVVVDALVFVPTPGCTLTGDVTGSSFHSHVSLIVHQYFNASISAEHLREAGFEFDKVQLQWYRDDKDQQTPLSSHDRIEFVCEKLFESGGIISIEGTKPSLLQPKEE